MVWIHAGDDGYITLHIPQMVVTNDIQKVYDKIIQNNSNRHKRAIFGRVLHIDGDKEYLDSCLSLYKELGIFSEGIYLSEKEVYKEIEKISKL